MQVEITCPKCNKPIAVTEALPGSRVECPTCRALLILDLRLEMESRRFAVQRIAGPQILSQENREQLRQLAIGHIANWLDVPAADIVTVLAQLDGHEAYEIWSIPKGNSGRFRQISSPSDRLKHIQRRILDRLLYRVPVSNAAHGFVQGRSIVTNAVYHLKTAQAIFSLDLKDAFPSVSALRVKHLFVRYLKIPLKFLGEDVPHAVLDESIALLVQLCTYNNGLPQGAPTSGYLLNMACIKLDKDIYRSLRNYAISGEVELRYTRYADDMTISAPKPIPEPIRLDLQKVIQQAGFQVNPQKVSYHERGRGQILEVTGLILEKEQVRIPAAKLEVFRASMHNASVLPTAELTPAKRLEIQSIAAFVKMVYGTLPHRIWAPYKIYLEKHGLPLPGKARKTYLDLYPQKS